MPARRTRQAVHASVLIRVLVFLLGMASLGVVGGMAYAGQKVPAQSPVEGFQPKSDSALGGCGIQEGFETGTLGQFASVVATCVPGGCGWRATPTPRSGAYSAFAPDVANISDQQMRLSGAVTIPASGGSLTFWHRYAFETPNYDGGVLEYSTNGGSTWADMGSRITTGGYNGTIDTGFQNPLLGRQAWIGTTSGQWTQVVVNLATLGNTSLVFRFRLGTDSSVSATGWFVDDIVVDTCGATNTPTRTATRTSTATRTPTVCPTHQIQGSIMDGDPTQDGRLKFFTPSPCGLSPSCPGQSDVTPRRYDSYTFVNPSTQGSVCVTVILNMANCSSVKSPAGNRFLDSVVYDGSFDPNNISLGGLCTNYRASAGSEISTTIRYAFDAPPGQPFTIVVSEETPGEGCASYTLNVSGSGCLLRVNTPTPTATATATGVACTISFSDVLPTDYFYEPVRYLYCMGAISGYADGTFRPYNTTTRSQLTKILVIAEGWTELNPPNPTFNDVPQTNPFYTFVETAYDRGIIAGYGCGGPGEPCPGLYFRPFNNVTRGQLCKIIVLAEGWPTDTTGGPHFNDVPQDNPFYDVIETAYNKGIIAGYDCGGPGEPCPGLYFRWGNNATRGQISKIVHLAITAE